MSGGDPIGEALARAIALVRVDARAARGGSDDVGSVAVVVPSAANAALLRRALADHGAFFAVWFETPEQIVAQLRQRHDDARPEPPGWLRPTVGRLLEELAAVDDDARRFLRPGWRDPLVRAIQKLESEGKRSADLAALRAVDDVSAHASLLSQLMKRVEDARADEGIAAPGRAVDVEFGVGAAAASAVVVAGDRILSASLLDPLSRWLQLRPRRCLRLPSTQALPRLPHGLQSAAGDAAVVDVDAPAPATRALRTPDDQREAVEIVRLVQRALRGSADHPPLPLDRIAVLVPDAQSTPALSRAFLRAEIPATFLVARPWRTLPVAGWLQLVVDIIAGDDSAATLAALLLHPCTNLVGLGGDVARARAEGDAIYVGRTRFRTLLGRGKDVRGAGLLAEVLALSAHEDEPRAGDVDADGSAGAGRVAWRKTARRNLVALLEQLDLIVRGARQQRSVGAHARALVDVVVRCARKSAGRSRLLSALLPLAGDGAGRPVSPEQLAEEITVLLDGTAPLEPLRDAAVRVMAPLQALGGSFDVVIAAGVVDGRLPATPREDAVLPDRLLARLGLDHALVSTIHELKERWRYAALSSCARRQLFLSLPAEEFDSGRPTVPLPFVRGLTVERQGSRAWPWRDDVGEALGDGERAVAGDVSGVDQDVVATAAAVVALEQKLRAGEVEPLPEGFTPPQPLSPEAFVELGEDPLTFFFRRVLLAWPAARVDSRTSLLEPRGLVFAVKAALEAAAASTSTSNAVDLPEQVAARVRALLDDARHKGADLDVDDVNEAVAVARARAAGFVEAVPGFAAAPATSVKKALGPVIVEDVPLRIVDDDVAAGGGRALVVTVTDKPSGATRKLQPAHVSLLLRDDDVTAVKLVDTAGDSAVIARDKAAVFVDDATARVSAVVASRRFASLSKDGKFSLDAERDRVRAVDADGAGAGGAGEGGEA